VPARAASSRRPTARQETHGPRSTSAVLHHPAPQTWTSSELYCIWTCILVTIHLHSQPHSDTDPALHALIPVLSIANPSSIYLPRLYPAVDRLLPGIDPSGNLHCPNRPIHRTTHRATHRDDAGMQGGFYSIHSAKEVARAAGKDRTRTYALMESG
jgi:hypothetical protein